MTKMHRPLILCVILTATVPAVTGCHSLGHVDELWLLKQYGDEADAMDEDIDVAEAEYRQIREDADNGRLAAGIDRDTVRERYGDPVYVQDPADRQGAAVMWMYRRPVHFFDSDRVLLYFNKEGRLIEYAVQHHQPVSGE